MARESLYKAEYCDDIVKFMSEGKSIQEYAVHLGIERKTLYNWADKYPEFASSKKEGEYASEAWWMNYGRLGTFGMLPNGAKLNATSYIYSMKCRFKGMWMEDGTTNKLEISHKHANLSEKELNRMIQAKLDHNTIDITPIRIEHKEFIEVSNETSR